MIQVVKKIIPICSCIVWLLSCGEKNDGPKRAIVLGDSSTIVTETDPRFLDNQTEDIAPNNHKSSAKKIAQMMVQVDSLNATKKLEENAGTVTTVSGLTISFEDFDVIFNNLSGHSAHKDPNEKKSNSVSYIYDGGDFKEMKVQVKNLHEVSVEEKLVTKLTASIQNERFVLQSLGTYNSPWYTLPGKDNLFISTGSNSVQFNDVNQNKLKQALNSALQNKRKSSTFTKAALEESKNARSAIDKPYVIEIYSVQYIVKGTVNGNKVKKLIRFDIPL